MCVCMLVCACLCVPVCVCVVILYFKIQGFTFSLQNAMFGNGLILQNLLHIQLAQQQLLHIKDKCISSVRYMCV